MALEMCIVRIEKNYFLKIYWFFLRELPKPTEKKSAPPPAPKPKPTSKSGQLIKWLINTCFYLSLLQPLD